MLPDYSEIFVDCYIGATFSDIGIHCSGMIINPRNNSHQYNFCFEGRRQSGFSVMLNLQEKPLKNQASIMVWDVYDYDGNAKGANYYDCELKVYYR